MRHERILKDLSSFMDGELETRYQERALGHLKTCESCRTEYEGLQKLNTLSAEFKRTEKTEPSPFFETRLKARISEGFASPQTRRGRSLPALAVLSAAFVFLFIIGSTFGSFASAFSQKDPEVRKKVIETTLGNMSKKPSILNLVTLVNFCTGCHSAICQGCGQCPPSGPSKDCCPAGTAAGETHE